MFTAIFTVYRLDGTRGGDEVFWPTVFEAEGFQDAVRQSLEQRPADPTKERFIIVANSEGVGCGSALFRVDFKQVTSTELTRVS